MTHWSNPLPLGDAWVTEGPDPPMERHVVCGCSPSSVFPIHSAISTIPATNPPWKKRTFDSKLTRISAILDVNSWVWFNKFSQKIVIFSKKLRHDNFLLLITKFEYCLKYIINVESNHPTNKWNRIQIDLVMNVNVWAYSTQFWLNLFQNGRHWGLVNF